MLQKLGTNLDFQSDAAFFYENYSKLCFNVKRFNSFKTEAGII